jgi:hypothetical protein
MIHRDSRSLDHGLRLLLQLLVLLIVSGSCCNLRMINYNIAAAWALLLCFAIIPYPHLT